MNNSEKVLQFLNNNQSQFCDDCLSEKTDIKPRQQIFQVCERLVQEGLIIRKKRQCSECGKDKKTNSIDSKILLDKSVPEKMDDKPHRPWFWEGNIQQTLVTYLAKEGYKIIRVAHTDSRENGRDIEAITPDGKKLWVSVKGWPEKSSNTQARHWFSQALFDIILYRDESEDTELALAFPDGFQTYLNLEKRIKWFKDTARFKIFWISEHGSIRIESEMPKIMQTTDRDIINQWIFGKIFGIMKDSLLIDMGLEKSNLDGYIGFCYIDDSMGISCRVHSLCKKEKGKKPDIVVNLHDALKDIVLRYDCLEVIEILDKEQVKSLGLEEKPTWLELYEYLELAPIRGREDLDQFRAQGFFDDVEAILAPKNLEGPGERIWVRLREIGDNENMFRGVLLNQPYADFGINEGDSVTVLLFKENDESYLVCGEFSDLRS